MRPKNMKGKLSLLTLLTILFVGYIGIKFFLLDKQNELGELNIVSTPNTNVFLDNVNVGRTPYDQKVKVGEYAIKLIPDKEATTTASWQAKIRIYKNAVTYINRELGTSDITSAGTILTVTSASPENKQAGTGEIYVETEPIGAIISLNNDERGVAPILLASVPKGTHEVSLYMPGFFRRTQKVNVEENRRVNAYFKLAIDQEAQKKQASEAAKLETKPATDSAKLSQTPTPTISGTQNNKIVRILQTPTGFLRVRSDPNVNASESARVNPGETYSVLDEQPNWYKIPYADGKQGWIASQYAKIVE